MKKSISMIGMILVMAVCMTIGSVTHKTAFAADTARKITVNGEGKVYVKPDIAYLDLGTTTSKVDAKAAQDENNEIMKKIIDAVKAEGIAETDIQTTSYNIYPQRDYNSNTEKISYYTATNSIRVTVRDITKAGTIIDKAISAGSNMNNGVSFSISDSSAYYNEALALALKSADTKAKAIAKSLSVTIGTPVEVTESGGYYTPYASDTAARSMTLNAAMPIQTGELTVSANVQVVYGY